MESLILSIVSWVITGFLGAVCGVLLARYKKYRKEMSALKEGVVSMLRTQIIQQHDKYMERGYAPIYAKDALAKCYNSYISLGGNGVVPKLYNDVMHLPEESSDEH